MLNPQRAASLSAGGSSTAALRPRRARHLFTAAGTAAHPAQLAERLVPRPPLPRRVAPQAPRKSAHVGTPVAQLLLPGTLDLLDVLERLLDRRPPRRRLQDVAHRSRRIGTAV